MQVRLIAGLVALLALAACAPSPNASDAPASFPVMLRIVNTSDSAIRIGGFPDFSPPIPQPSSGVLSVGVALPGVTCFALPDSIVMHMNPGTPLASLLVWHGAAQGLSLTESGGHGGYSENFVPGAAHGWSITVPGINTTPTEAMPCTP